MTRQFIIVNNGMTEMRGHYVETALSVAEAARLAGLRPTLATHVDCPLTMLPDWLTCLPNFRVNHWADRIRVDPPVPASLVRSLARRWLPGFVRNLVRRSGRSPAVPISATGACDETSIARQLAHKLRDPVANHDLYCSGIFREDMEKLLARLGVNAADHVFLPTAHFREAYAIRQVIAARGVDHSPRFHLEFRHEVTPASPGEPPSADHVGRLSALGEQYFQAIRAYPATDRLRYYTDTAELARDYSHLCGVGFEVLPIPFAHDFIANSPVPGSPPFRCVYLGDIRAEKGFQSLPKLVRALRDEIERGLVRFVIQGTRIHANACSRELIASLAELAAYPSAQVELVGRDQPFLERAEYYELLARADVVVCTHDARNYRARSSGILAEAIAAGKPVVVPAGTWLAQQMPAGCGAIFTDEISLADAVRTICKKYNDYHGRLQMCRDRWLARHSPAALLNLLLSNGLGHSAQAA